MPFEFGPPDDPGKFRLEADGLTEHGNPKKLRPQALEVLSRLVQAKHLSFASITEGGHGVDWLAKDLRGSAVTAIKEIKKVLGKSAIRRIPKLGYTFAWTVDKNPPPVRPRTIKGVLRPLHVPSGMLPRKSALAKIKRVLLRKPGPNQRTVLTAAAGMGGIGKTILASLAMNDPEVQARFPDGIIALTIGKMPKQSHLIEEIGEIPRNLGESDSGWDLKSAFDLMGPLLIRRKVLLVLDDVWHVKDLGWLPGDLGDSAVLITTRFKHLDSAIEGVELIEAEALDPDEARELLADKAKVPVKDLPPEADRVLRHCGLRESGESRSLLVDGGKRRQGKFLAESCVNALAVAMAGALFSKTNDWNVLVNLFAKSDLKKIGFEFNLRDRKHANIYEVIHASVEYLDKADRERYLALSAFPDDVAIPEPVIGRLWKADNDSCKLWLGTLRDSCLLNWRDEVITIHDLHMDYLRCYGSK